MHYTATQISPSVAKIMADKRDSRRVKSVFSASVHVDGEFKAHCVIKDVSETGMRLQFQKAIKLPDTFEVKTPAITEIVHVRIAWNKGTSCGVEFVELENQNS